MPAAPEPRRRAVRLVLAPLLLLVGVSALIYGLARAQPFAPAALTPGAVVATGNAARGRQLFLKNCSGCHGTEAQGAIGPKLRGDAVTLALAQSRIEQGKGAMPAGLVSGEDEKDVLGYLATILKHRGQAAGGGR